MTQHYILGRRLDGTYWPLTLEPTNDAKGAIKWQGAGEWVVCTRTGPMTFKPHDATFDPSAPPQATVGVQPLGPWKGPNEITLTPWSPYTQKAWADFGRSWFTDLEVTEMVTLSTAHVPGPDSLVDFIFENEYAAVYYLDEGTEVECPVLQGLITLFRALGFQFLRLDRDGPTHPQLETFRW
jgi:hypothetical protein